MNVRSQFSGDRLYWASRAVGFVLLVGVFSGVIGSGIGSRHEVVTIVQMVVIGLLIAFLAYRDLRAHASARQVLSGVDIAALTALVACGGITAELGLQSVPIAYSAVACYAASARLPARQALAITAVGIVAVEVSGILFGWSAGPSLGWPLVLITCTRLGSLRQLSDERGRQLEAMMEEMVRAQDRDRRAAALEERHRIAREIHDVLAHSLSALGLQIEAVRSVLTDGRDPALARDLLDRAQSLADHGLAESREAIHALRTDAPPLPDALAAIVAAHNERWPAQARVSIVGIPYLLSAEASVALVRVAHEAVANAARHAPGRPVTLHLTYGPAVTTLSVVNPTADGASAPDAAGGYGLAGMRERVALLGGSLAAGPSETGWSVTATVPR